MPVLFKTFFKFEIIVTVINIIVFYLFTPQKSTHEVDDHMPEYKRIKRVADELTRNKRSRDSTFVTDLMRSFERNWQTMEEALTRL